MGSKLGVMKESAMNRGKAFIMEYRERYNPYTGARNVHRTARHYRPYYRVGEVTTALGLSRLRPTSQAAVQDMPALRGPDGVQHYRQARRVRGKVQQGRSRVLHIGSRHG